MYSGSNNFKKFIFYYSNLSPTLAFPNRIIYVLAASLYGPGATKQEKLSLHMV